MAVLLNVASANVGDDPPGAADLQQELHSRLESGERLLWRGYPPQGFMLRAQDAFLVPFSLLWGGFAIFWEYSVVTATRAPFLFRLWGVPFVCIGLYMIGGRFLWDERERAATIYAVTNQRVLIVSGVRRRNVRSLELSTLGETSLSETADGRGTITFGPANPYATWGRSWPGSGRSLSPAFEGIARARDVLRIIRDAKKSVGSEIKT